MLSTLYHFAAQKATEARAKAYELGAAASSAAAERAVALRDGAYETGLAVKTAAAGAAALSYITAPLGATGTIPEYKPIKSRHFYLKFLEECKMPYAEIRTLIRSLNKQSAPHLTQRIPIPSYLQLLKESVISKIYTKLYETWGYNAFFRVKEGGLKGIAHAFIMHVILTDSPKEQSPIHDKLVQFYSSILERTLYPDLQESLSCAFQALKEGQPHIKGVLQTEPSMFLDPLTESLLRSFQSEGRELDFSLEHYIEITHDKELGIAHTTLQGTYDKLLPLLGKRHTLLGPGSFEKYQMIMRSMNAILTLAKTRLEAKLDPTQAAWLKAISSEEFMKLFDTPAGLACKETLYPQFKTFFKEELRNFFTRNSTALKEDLPRAVSDEIVFNALADLFLSFELTELAQILQADPKTLSKLCQTLEAYEEKIQETHLQFIHFLTTLFPLSFIVHYWQKTHGGSKRLKIHTKGPWHQPSCHLLIYPKSPTGQIDLLEPLGLYAPRDDLEIHIHDTKFTFLKAKSSQHLSRIALSSEVNNQTKLASHLLYYRLHIFACLDLLMAKLSVLDDPIHFMQYGNREDDFEQSNPFGPDPRLEPQFDTEEERSKYIYERHLAKLNQELADLEYLADCVFSRHKEEGKIGEIKKILTEARKKTLHIQLNKVAHFIEDFTRIIEDLKTKSHTHYLSLKGALDPSLGEAYTRFFSQENLAKFYPEPIQEQPPSDEIHLGDTRINRDISRLSLALPSARSTISRGPREDSPQMSLIRLIPHLALELDPPPIFSQLKNFARELSVYQKVIPTAEEKQRALRTQKNKIYQEIQEMSPLFLQFYPEKQRAFQALFSSNEGSDLSIDMLDSLIPLPSDIIMNCKEVIRNMQQLLGILLELDEIQKVLNNVAQLLAAKRALQAALSDFVAINPSKEALFIRHLESEDLFSLSVYELHQLCKVPRSEEGEFIKGLRELLRQIQKTGGYRKEQAKLILLQTRYETEPDTVAFELGLNDHRPRAGSLCDAERDDGSDAGRSQSSSLLSLTDALRLL